MNAETSCSVPSDRIPIMSNRVSIVSLVVILIFLTSPHPSFAQSLPTVAPLSEHWVGTWAAAPQLTEPNNLPPAPGLSDTTLRQIVHVSIGGTRIRVRFTNAFGAVPLTISSAQVAVAVQPGTAVIKPATAVSLAFCGQPSVTLAAGTSFVSDPIDFGLAPQSDLAITVHVSDTTMAITGHPGSRTTSFFLTGEHVSDADLPMASTTAHWYYLYGVDVVANPASAAVAILGDSITDGRGSTTDHNNRWPDDLAQRLLTNKATENIAVLNEGIGGNRLLGDGLGPSALSRLDRDVLVQPGVKWMILFEGINDLGGHATSDKIIDAYAQINTRAHARGLKVYGATITPCGGSFYDNGTVVENVAAVNDWVRTSGGFDAVIDFYAAVDDPKNPGHLLPAFDSGDHLHLSPAGYVAMAKAIDLKLFAGKQ